jgi:type II secretory pathway component PulF
MNNLEQRRKKNSLIQNILLFEVDIAKARRIFFESLVLMLSSGIDVLTSLEGIAEETSSKQLKLNIADIITEIKGGSPLWQSLNKYSIVPESLIKIIQIGEDSGNLSKNMGIVLEDMRKNEDIKSKLLSASLYPGIVLIIMVVVGTLMSVFVLPRMTEMYSSLKVDLPWYTEIVISFGAFMKEYGLIVAPTFLIVLTLLLLTLFVFKRTKWLGQNLLFSIPSIANVIKELEFTRMGYLMGSLTSSGFTAVESLKILESSTDSHIYKKLYKYLYTGLEKGDTFKNSFSGFKNISRLLPVYIRQSLITGEKTGTLSSAFLQISSMYEKQNEYTTRNLNAIFEPALLFIVWVGVALLAFSVIMPMYNLVGNFTSLSGNNADQTLEEANLKPTYVKTNAAVDTLYPIYETPDGNILNYINPEEKYEYRQFKDGWYEIVLPSGLTAWIQEKNVTEISE